jgi:hypothetical protein
MNDNEYFSQYKQSFEMIFAPDAEDCAFIKDAEFRYQSVTAKFLNMLGANAIDDIVGKTLAEFSQVKPICNPQLIGQLSDQDVRIERHKKRKTYLEVLCSNGKNNIFLCYKTPLINPENNNFVGIRGQITNLVLPHVVKTLFKMHGTKGLLLGHKNGKESPLKEYPLTNIQHMVLFLALNNYSYSEISLLLSEFGHQVTPVRVNDYLEQLKLIFHVRNKIQLIEKAIGLNLHTFLPNGLFSKLSSIEVSDAEAAIVSGSPHE